MFYKIATYFLIILLAYKTEAQRWGIDDAITNSNYLFKQQLNNGQKNTLETQIDTLQNIRQELAKQNEKKDNIMNKYLYTSSASTDDISLQISIHFGISEYTSNCKHKKCYIGFIQKAIQGSVINLGYPTKQGVQPIFLLSVDSADYKVTTPKNLASSWKLAILKISQAIYQSPNNLNKENLQNNDAKHIKDNLQITTLRGSKQLESTLTGQLTHTIPDNNNNDVLFNIKIKHLQTIQNSNLLIDKIISLLNSQQKITNSKEKIVKFIQQQLVSKSKMQVKVIKDKNNKNIDLSTQNLSSQKKKQVLSVTLISETKKIISFSTLSKQFSLQLKLECFYYMMASGPHELGCSASAYFLVFGERKDFINFYSYRRPYNQEMRISNQINEEWRLSLDQYFPQVGYGKVEFSTVIKCRITTLNQLKNIQINPLRFELMNRISIDLSIDGSREVVIGFLRGKQQKIGVSMKGSLMKAEVQSSIVSIVNSSRNINYFTKKTLKTQNQVGNFQRYHIYLDVLIIKRPWPLRKYRRIYQKKNILQKQPINSELKQESQQTNIIAINL